MKYRSRTEIVCNILDAANEGVVTKTTIMYAAFLYNIDIVKDALLEV
jgi:predicted transcriptional regulator